MTIVPSTFSALPRALSPPGLLAFAGQPRATSPPWGDGFVDEGMDFAWSVRSFDDVCDDELVFLLPALARSPASVPARLDSRLRSVLARQASRLIEQLWGNPGIPESRDALALLLYLHQLGYMTSMRPGEAWREIERLGPTAFPNPGRSASWLDTFGWRREARSERTALAIEMLGSVDRLHADACRTEAERRSTSVVAGVFASISSGINAAYIYPELGCMHQTMTAGCWLGHLLRGRAALMPLSVAELLLDIVKDGDAPTHPADDLIRAHLDPAGAAVLMAAARRVARDGRARHISARHFASLSRGSTTRVLALVAAADR